MSDQPAILDPVEVAMHAEIKRLRDDLDARDLAWILEDQRGRRLLGVLVFDICGVQKDGFTGEALSMAANAGARNVGLQLLGRSERLNYTAVLRMLQEREAERMDFLLRLRRAQREDDAETMPVSSGASGPLDDATE